MIFARGELEAAELYQALLAFGQNVSDDDVVKMMEEVDDDGSGSVDFEEFILLAIPGLRTTRTNKKPRGFAISPCRSAMFEDAEGTTGVADIPIEVPAQCFFPASEDEEGMKDQDGARRPPRKLAVELRLRFKRSPHDALGRSESARDGNIVLPLTVAENVWVEKMYPFDDKMASTGCGGAGITFTAPDPPDPAEYPMPLSKLKCVKFPNGPIKEDGHMVDGFRIVSVKPKKLQISFDYKYGKYAVFPPPPYEFTIIETGSGTHVRDIKVGALPFRPRRFPPPAHCC